MAHLMPRKGVPCEKEPDDHAGQCRPVGFAEWDRERKRIENMSPEQAQRDRERSRERNRRYKGTAKGILAQMRHDAKRRGNR